MRQWKVNVSEMCNRHLLGEHVEHHMFVGSINKGISIAGYLSRGLVRVSSLKARHDEISAEMTRRGMVHNSPLPDFQYNGDDGDVKPESFTELMNRCEECRNRMEMVK